MSYQIFLQEFNEIKSIIQQNNLLFEKIGFYITKNKEIYVEIVINFQSYQLLELVNEIEMILEDFSTESKYVYCDSLLNHHTHFNNTKSSFFVDLEITATDLIKLDPKILFNKLENYSLLL